MTGRIDASPGSSVEASIFFRPIDEPVEELRYQATHDDPQELLYIPQAEWEQFLSRQSEDVWLGPPIFGGCINRPADQLIPRSLGMDILHRRRFSWNNEDLSLWRMTEASRSIATLRSRRPTGCSRTRTTTAAGTRVSSSTTSRTASPPALPLLHRAHVPDRLLRRHRATSRFSTPRSAARSSGWASHPRTATPKTPRTPTGTAGAATSTTSATRTSATRSTRTRASCLIFSLLWTRLQDEEAKMGLDYGSERIQAPGSTRACSARTASTCYMLSQLDPRLELPGDPPYFSSESDPADRGRLQRPARPSG